MIHLESSRKHYEKFRKAFLARTLDELYKDDNDEDKQDGGDDENGELVTPERRRYLRKYIQWLGRYWKTTLLLILLSLGVAALDMTHPLFLRYILDDVLLDERVTNIQRLHYLNVIGLAYLLIIIVGQLLGVLKDYGTRQLNVRVVLSLRRTLFDRMIHLPLSKLTDMKTGGIISRLTGDVNMTSGLLQLGLISPGVSMIRLVITLAMLFYLNWRLALIGVTVLPIAMGISFFVARRIRPIYRVIRKDAGHVDARVGEVFGGIRVVRGFQREALEDLNHAIGRHTIIRKQLFAHRRELALWTTWGFMISGISLAAIWVGGVLYVRGTATIGDIMAFQWYALMLLNPVWQIVNSFSELQRSLAAMERVFEVLELQPDKPDKEDALDAPQEVTHIEFDHVDFAYRKDTPVIRDFNLTVPGGYTVALVGRSGAGKTTIGDLVARFYDPLQGSIRVNGRDIRDYRLATYRQRLGIVQQDVFLFDGSVRENIAYARPDASDEEVERAARRAHAEEFIVDLAEGYDTMIGERGVKLSGGQAQRLSIARAMLADPQILILDEATSSLDSESEQLIQASIVELLSGRTTFVIAHRLSTIADADLIVVMDAGRIVEQGKHEELIGRGGLYADMIARQQDAINV